MGPRPVYASPCHVFAQQELSSQVLVSGHEERSASYHLLMLDRLVELACARSIHSHDLLASELDRGDGLLGQSRALKGGMASLNDSAVDVPTTRYRTEFCRSYYSSATRSDRCCWD